MKTNRVLLICGGSDGNGPAARQRRPTRAGDEFLSVPQFWPSRAHLARQLHEARTWQLVWSLVAVCGWITAGAIIYLGH